MVFSLSFSIRVDPTSLNPPILTRLNSPYRITVNPFFLTPFRPKYSRYARTFPLLKGAKLNIQTRKVQDGNLGYDID